jgi:branched-chain amino acid transport system substrate-binding protein
MRRQRFTFALGAALLAALASAPPATAQGPVKLAIVAEITGGGAPSGTMYRDGVILGAEEINKKGGILGRQLETFVMDTQSDPPTSVAVIRRAINEQPFAIMGTVYSSTGGQHGASRARRDPPDQRVRVGAGRQQGATQHLPDVLQPADRLRQAVKWVADDLKADKIALIYVNTRSARAAATCSCKFLKDRGKSLVADISTEVSRRTSPPSSPRSRSGRTHLMIYSHEEENARIMIQMRKLGLKVEPVGDNLCAQTTIDAGGEAMNGARCHVPMTRSRPCRACWRWGSASRSGSAACPTTTGSRATSART